MKSWEECRMHLGRKYRTKELFTSLPTEMDAKCMDVALPRHVETESVGAGNNLFKKKTFSFNILTFMEGIKDYTNML